MLIISLSVLSNSRSYGAEEEIANFVFGDSNVDVGNNDYIVSLAKANNVPYGIDYGGPTGRFTNGRTIVDILDLAQTLGKFGQSPPYLAPTTKGSVILKGVNYASGGAGILNETGSVFRLYNMGAKKILVTNVGVIGCIPYERKLNLCLGNQCAANPNQLAQSYNVKLKSLLTELNNNLKGSNFVYGDTYGTFNEVIYHYQSYGFENVNSPCCSNNPWDKSGSLLLCSPSASVCCDRSKYAFWDPFHPTEATNMIIAKRLIDGNISYISPINIRQLLNS
uniref:Uncharacterized protein n=1 Tax=Chenopodium quinoa TaxID=63459 RepID=A0A803LM77_CHEQI